MQLFLILGIVFAIGAVGFAFQNDVPVTVMLSNWHFDSSLAVVLLIALGMGALIAALVSTPTVIEGQWARTRLRRQIAGVEKEKEILDQRLRGLELELARLSPDPAPSTRAYVPHTGSRTTLPGERVTPETSPSPERVMQRTRWA